MIRPGQVALVTFQQTDLRGGKLRPVLVIARVPGNHDDWLIAMISSQLRQAIVDFDETIDPSSADFPGSGLKTASVVRVGRLAVVEAGVLEGMIGAISEDRLTRIKSRLAKWIAES